MSGLPNPFAPPDDERPRHTDVQYDLGICRARLAASQIQRDMLIEHFRVIAETEAADTFARHYAATIVNLFADCDAFPWADLQGILDNTPRQSADRVRHAIKEARAA